MNCLFGAQMVPIFIKGAQMVPKYKQLFATITRHQRQQKPRCYGAFRVSYGAPSRIRTLDPLIKSQLLYQLS